MASYAPPASIARFQRIALTVGIGFMALFIVGYFLDPAQFFHSYLFAFSFWAGIAIGSLSLLMLQHLTGGGWGFVIRRVLEAATRTLPFVAILFVPVILGAHSIYRWTDHEYVAHHPALALKSKYLNLPFFSIRAVIYFAIWFLLAFFLNRWSKLQDQTGDRQFTRRMQTLSGPGMVLFVFTVSGASIDWFMSLDPEWYSTIYGFILVAAWTLSALAFVIAVLASLAKHEPMNAIVAQLHFHDLGKLLLALVMLWSYFAFSQYLIVWSANLPEEIRWYRPRTQGGWGVLAVTVIVLHFAFPFLFLLSRSLKRNAGKLVLVAALVLVMRLLDLLWMIAPTPTWPGEHSFHISWMDVVAPIGMGGLWLAAFARSLMNRPLIPINDPQFESVLQQGQAHADH